MDSGDRPDTTTTDAVYDDAYQLYDGSLEAFDACVPRLEIAAGVEPRRACVPTQYLTGFCHQGHEGYPQLLWAPEQMCSDFRAPTPDTVVDCEGGDYVERFAPPTGWHSEPTPLSMTPTIECNLAPEFCPRIVRSFRMPYLADVDPPRLSYYPVSVVPTPGGHFWLWCAQSAHYLTSAGDLVSGYRTTATRGVAGVPDSEDLIIVDRHTVTENSPSREQLGLVAEYGIQFGPGVVRVAPDGTVRWRVVLYSGLGTPPALVVDVERRRVYTYASTNPAPRFSLDIGVVGIAEIDLDTGEIVGCHPLAPEIPRHSGNGEGAAGVPLLALDGNALIGRFGGESTFRYDLTTRTFAVEIVRSMPRTLVPLGDGTYLSGLGLELRRLDADLRVVQRWRVLEGDSGDALLDVSWFPVLIGPRGQMFAQTSVGGLEFTLAGLDSDPPQVLGRTYRGGGAAYLADGTLMYIGRTSLSAYAAGEPDPLWTMYPAVSGGSWAVGVIPISNTHFVTGDANGGVHIVEHVHGPLAQSPAPLSEGYDIWATNVVPQGPFPEGPQWPRVWRRAAEGSGAEGSGG